MKIKNIWLEFLAFAIAFSAGDKLCNYFGIGDTSSLKGLLSRPMLERFAIYIACLCIAEFFMSKLSDVWDRKKTDKSITVVILGFAAISALLFISTVIPIKESSGTPILYVILGAVNLVNGIKELKARHKRLSWLLTGLSIVLFIAAAAEALYKYF